MKYLLDHRYKKLNAIFVHASSILTSCKNGRSLDLGPSLRALQEEIQDLESLKSPPFSERQIQAIDEIQEKGFTFLLLPENLEEIGLSLLETSERLLIDIDPFTYSLEDSLGVRKSQCLELLKEVQIYLKAHLISLEAEGDSVIDEAAIVSEIMQDLSRIQKNDMSKEEMAMIENLFQIYLHYQQQTSIEAIKAFMSLASHAEILFKENEAPYKTLSELIGFLRSVYRKANIKMKSDKESFPQFTAFLRMPLVASGLFRLKELELASQPLSAARENLLFAYEHAALEDGETFVSRCRAIDFYKLFGYEVAEFEMLLQDSPEKDFLV